LEVYLIHQLDVLSLDNNVVVGLLQLVQMLMQLAMEAIEVIGERIHRFNQYLLRFVLTLLNEINQVLIVVIMHVHLLSQFHCELVLILREMPQTLSEGFDRL
jgi:hypothetical protein